MDIAISRVVFATKKNPPYCLWLVYWDVYQQVVVGVELAVGVWRISLEVGILLRLVTAALLVLMEMSVNPPASTTWSGPDLGEVSWSNIEYPAPALLVWGMPK